MPIKQNEVEYQRSEANDTPKRSRIALFNQIPANVCASGLPVTAKSSQHGRVEMDAWLQLSEHPHRLYCRLCSEWRIEAT
jgi:hypothetical protein